MSVREWKGSWQADVCYAGIRRKRSFPTKKQAIEWERMTKVKLREGYYPFDRPISFSAFSKIYMERRLPGRTPHSAGTVMSRMKHLNEFFGDYLFHLDDPAPEQELERFPCYRDVGFDIERHTPGVVTGALDHHSVHILTCRGFLHPIKSLQVFSHVVGGCERAT